MNRALRNQHAKRCAFRKHGGGYGLGSPLVPFDPSNDMAFSSKMPVNQSFDDCAFPNRPGQIINEPNVALAQVVMAGGGCGCMLGQSGGGCGCMRGGRKTRRSRMKGGVYAVDPTMSIGGYGPNVAPAYVHVPCDGRAGATSAGNPDMRAPTDIYSITANQMGGGVSGAPGSMIPVYHAETAGFRFTPSIVALPDGVTAFNEVVPYAARLGGARKKSRRAKKSSKGTRKGRKGTRKAYRKH